MRANRLDKSILRIVAEDLFPQLSRGVEVFRVDGGEEGAGVREEAFAVNLVEIDGSVSELDGIDGRQVVGSTALVEECHLAVTLEVAHSVRANGLVDRQLLVVGADSMERQISEPYLSSRRYVPVSVSIRVGEQSTLQHGVGGRLDSGWHVRRVERDLLDFREVVFGVGVERHGTNLAQLELVLRPDVAKESSRLVSCAAQRDQVAHVRSS